MLWRTSRTTMNAHAAPRPIIKVLHKQMHQTLSESAVPNQLNYGRARTAIKIHAAGKPHLNATPCQIECGRTLIKTTRQTARCEATAKRKAECTQIRSRAPLTNMQAASLPAKPQRQIRSPQTRLRNQRNDNVRGNAKCALTARKTMTSNTVARSPRQQCKRQRQKSNERAKPNQPECDSAHIATTMQAAAHTAHSSPQRP